MCSTYRMTIARPKQFPSGFLVAALLAANGLLWAVMFFGPLAHLERLASGLMPFDIRPKVQHDRDVRFVPISDNRTIVNSLVLSNHLDQAACGEMRSLIRQERQGEPQ
jgi:hypothetical protein